MANTLKHKTPWTAARISSPEWNDEHAFAGGSHGALLFRDTAATDGARWLAPGDVGFVLVSGGFGATPEWSASLTLADLTLAAPLAAGSGGTGLTTYAIGDIPYASGTATLARRAAVAVGSVLASGGVGAAPVWSATPTLTSVLFGGDATLTRDAAHVLAQRSGTNAQAFRVYNTFTDASNYERGFVRWSSNTFQIGTESAGTGATTRNVNILAAGTGQIRFNTGGTDWWAVNASGHLVAVTDNTSDIGATGATRPKDIHLAGNLRAGGFVHVQGSAGLLLTAGVGLVRIGGASDGVLTLADNAAASFGRLQFGGTADTFPALARSGADLSIVGAAAGVANSSLLIPSQKAATGQRYLQIDTNGRITSSATAPVGT